MSMDTSSIQRRDETMTSNFIDITMAYAPCPVALRRKIVALGAGAKFFLGNPILNLLGFLGEWVAHPQPLAEKDNNWEDL